MSGSPGFDFKHPDYVPVYVWRDERLDLFEAEPELLAAAKRHYREAPWDFISDWGNTVDPRLLERGVDPVMPFVLWPRQVEYLKWVMARWRAGERGLVEKSRDCGVTWLSAALAATLWLFIPGFTCNFGSRKEDLVDKRGDMNAIFPKIWAFIQGLPPVFLPAGLSDQCRAHMRILNPENGAAITGEAGDDIGRGGRASLVFVDEAAFIEHQEMVDAALSQTTNCQIDISTPNGSGNLFYKKRMRFNNTDRVFVFDWRADPRKDDAWYAKQREEQDEVTVAQEIDRDYNASVEGVFIPAKWVKAAIDAHVRLGFKPSGLRSAGFDPADVGDARALIIRHGVVITAARQKKDGEAADAVEWAFEQADAARVDVFGYDGDGMGRPVIRTALRYLNPDRLAIVAYHGSGPVREPGLKRKAQSGREKSALDTYQNYRAQTWSEIRDRFERTYTAIEAAAAGHVVRADPAELISIDSRCGDLEQLVAELSRPLRKFNGTGKILVESKADMKKRGVDSPNLADAAVIAMAMAPAPKSDGKPPKTTPSAGKARTRGWMAH